MLTSFSYVEIKLILKFNIYNTLPVNSFKANCKVLVDKGAGFMKIAAIGNVIEFGDGLQGIVEKVNENSVIVNLTYMENFNELDMEERTVVNHKRYKILSNAAEK